MKNIILYPFSLVFSLFENIGRYFDLMIKTFRSFKSWPIYLNTLPDHLMILGVTALPIVALTGLFTGMVTSVQAAYQFESGFIPGSAGLIFTNGPRVHLEIHRIPCLSFLGKIFFD